MGQPNIHYELTPVNSGAHLIRIQIKITGNNQDKLTLKIPKWIPGSYKIRDYTKNISRLSVKNSLKEVDIKQIGTSHWEINTDKSDVLISYDYYAYDLSVRGCYYDQSRMFINFCCLCFNIIEYQDLPCYVSFNSLNQENIFTALPREKDIFCARNYEHLIDCPAEISSKYLLSRVKISEINHNILFTGYLDDNYDLDFLTSSIKKICKAQIKLFTESPLEQDYTFMTYIEPGQYGGLEHAHSTALMASPDMISKKHVVLTDANIGFLSLCSHEYFHLWNIKRLRPKDLIPYDLHQEQPTEMLWMFEGFTSYYDELMLLRANIINKDKFLERQAKNITRVLSVPARRIQTIAESSFNAWTKLYQADENAHNLIVSYYSKGAYFALYLDLFIRKYSQNKYSLDDVMRGLWKSYAKKGIGIDEDIVINTCLELLAKNQHALLKQVFMQGIHGYSDLDFKKIFLDFGICCYKDNNTTHTSKNTTPGFECKLVDQKVIIHKLDVGSYASKNGISAGDEIISINEHCARDVKLDDIFYNGILGDKICLTIKRRSLMLDMDVVLEFPEIGNTSIKIVDANELTDSWLESWC